MKLQYIAHITLLVKNYDEAIDFYSQKLGFTVLEDNKLAETKRWVVIAPNSAKEAGLLLAQADGDVQARSVGNQ